MITRIVDRLEKIISIDVILFGMVVSVLISVLMGGVVLHIHEELELSLLAIIVFNMPWVSGAMSGVLIVGFTFVQCYVSYATNGVYNINKPDGLRIGNYTWAETIGWYWFIINILFYSIFVLFIIPWYVIVGILLIIGVMLLSRFIFRRKDIHSKQE